MSSSLRRFQAIFVLCVAALTAGAQPPRQDEPLAATVETTLMTATGQIRQFAFDGNPDTFFTSNPGLQRSDHFTLVLDRPVTMRTIAVATGRPDGSERLESGVLEVSTDSKEFTPVGKFTDGIGCAQLEGRLVRAVRLRPDADPKRALVIREITLESQPAVAVFRYPVEFTVDVSDAPEMQEWADKVARICERQYTMLNEELQSEGFKPPHLVKMTLTNRYKGVAAAGGGRITGSVKYFKDHPDDVGAMVHETAHIVQSYRTPNNPSWLVEGVADYVRFFKFEPGKLGRLNPDRARYNGSYRTTAAFLAYLAEKYDPQIVRKLNKAMREGEYRDEIFKALTTKSVQELDEEWRASLRGGAGTQSAKIVLVAGSNFFKPGEHEYAAGCAVLADLLRQSPGVVPVVVLDWPKEPATFAGAKAVVFFFDGGDKHALLQGDRLAQVQKLVDAGVGLVHFHQVIDYPKDLAERARGWMGAAWEKGYGARAHWVAEFRTFPAHPIFRGVQPFKIDDGWLYKLRFVPGLKGVTPLLRTVSPKAPAGTPDDESIIAWAYERPGGGRSFTFTGGHLHQSFAEEGYRRFLVNGILWSAGLEVPTAGAPVALEGAALGRYLEKRPGK